MEWHEFRVLAAQVKPLVNFYMDFNSDVRVTDILFSTSRIPHIVWEYYLEYLWYYHPESYVARIASTFRVLAVVITIPVVILALLVCIKLTS